MTRRAHQTESTLSAHCRARSINRSASGSHRVLVNITMRRGIGIEVTDGVSYSREVFGGMCSQQCDFIGIEWLAPFPLTMSILQYRDRACDAPWLFRMSGAGILRATGIVKNDHRGCNVALERIFDYDNVKRRDTHRLSCISRDLLERLPLEANSDDFVFDNQVLAQVIALSCAIGELT